MAAITWPRQRLDIIVHDDNLLALITRRMAEGASQTFPDGAPLKITSGLLLEWVSVADADLAAFSRSAGKNVASGGKTDVVLAVPGVEVEANFLGAAAAANILAAGDLGTAFELLKSTTLIDGTSPGWYIADVTSAPIVRIAQFKALNPVAVKERSEPAADDIDARVRAIPLISKLKWYD